MALPDERFEICYLLDAEAKARIAPALRLRLLPCPLSGAGGAQRLQALYFGDAAAGSPEPRRVLRVRIHETEGRPLRCVVEVKHRIGLRSTVHQERVTIADALLVTKGLPVASAGAAPRLLEEARQMAAGGLRPSVLVGCERLALVGDDREEDLRVTIDSAVRFRRRDLRLRPWDEPFEGDVLAPGASLLVIKVARAVPHWLTLLLGRSGSAQRTAGKHALALHAATLFGAPPEPAELEG